MRAGKNRRRITVQRATETQDSYGEPDETWTALDTVWANIAPLKGSERWAADVTQGEEQVALSFRYGSELKNLTPKDRAIRGATVYDFIEVVNVEERNKEYRVLATVRYG